jgi:uncharacterized coiled-coil protein SlyX
MKITFMFFVLVTLSLFSRPGFAQSLEDRLKTLEETISNQAQVQQQLQEALKKQGETIDEQRKLIEQLKAEVSQHQQPAATKAAVAAETAPSEEMKQQVRELKDEVNRVAEAQRKVLPSEFNPAIGLVGETIFSYRSKGKEQTGSDRPGGYDVFQRSVELNASASVDPFASAYVVANASADPVTGEADLGIEEAAIQTESLPWNLTLKAGRFFGEFGRLSYIHGHELPFVNRPLVLDRYIGGESKTDGAQLNWLVPIEHYVSLTAGLGDQFGGDFPNPNNVGDFRHFSGLNFWSRLSTYFDLTPEISLEPGISGLWNPHTVDRGGAFEQPDGSSLTERERRLAGADLTLSWKPLRNNQFKSLTWGTEVLYSDNRYDVTDSSGNALPKRSVGSLGLYTYLAYKFHRQWTTGFLFDWVEDPQDQHAQTFAYSPYLTWALSHWNQLRLQYTYTDHNAASAASGLRPDHAVYLQWAWIIGSHSHGWQQR